LSAISISNPNFLFIVSSLTGLAYGFLFGVFPSLVAEAFGVHGLSQNWGCMSLAPVFSGNIFNILYGVIFDAHSKVLETGERVCEEGLDCYRNAYLMTIAACVLGIATSLWSIHYSHSVKEKARKLEEREA
jgi:MFS family permease